MTDKFHPETLALGDALKSINLRPYYEHPSLDSAREQSRQVHTILAGSYDFDGKRTEEFIPAQHIPGILTIMCEQLTIIYDVNYIQLEYYVL